MEAGGTPDGTGTSYYHDPGRRRGVRRATPTGTRSLAPDITKDKILQTV